MLLVLSLQLFGYDNELYRTFSPARLATAEKAIKRQITTSEWSFTFTNNTNYTVDGLYIETGQSVISFKNIQPFSNHSAPTQDRKRWQLNGASIPPGGTVTISGIGSKKAMKVKRWYWTVNGNRVGFLNRLAPPGEQKFFLPMPNISNLGEEMFKHTALSKGLVIGIPQTEKNTNYAWVRITKWKQLQQNLIDNSGMHIGNPQGFKSFVNGKPIKGEQKVLSPKKYNDRLFAELVSLKFTIATSSYGRIPVGLGNLIINEPSNPLNGMSINEIVSRADSAMTFYTRYTATEFKILEETISKINRAFEGPVDTLSFGLKTVFTGAKSLSDVTFLMLGMNSSNIPLADDGLVQDEVEDEALYSIPIQNYPNPFNPTTVIEFELNDPALVSLKVYDMLGREISILADNKLFEAGIHRLDFDARGLSAGVYFYNLIVRGLENQEMLFRTAKKMVLSK